MRYSSVIDAPPASEPVRERLAFTGRRIVSRGLSAAGIRHPWVKPRRNPRSPRRLEEFKLFAILGTWMEEDVVGANVRNAFTQGCDRVFLVDNDSPDRTVDEALEAGAELAQSFSTPTYEEHLRNERMNNVVSRISAADGSDHIWWLWLDADEFSHGPRGLTIREFLASLDTSFRIVGARYLNHYPGEPPHYVTGFHPLDFQPLAEELPDRLCWSWHRKHPLQRFDRGRPKIQSSGGFHWAESAERPLLEPAESVFLHHFPFREKAATLRRLRGLHDPAADSSTRHGVSDGSARFQAIEAVYSQDWQTLRQHIAPRFRRPEGAPVPWTTLAGEEHASVARWY